MLERIRLASSPRRGRNLMRAALLATLSLGAWSSLDQTAFAQLRSGRSDRPLYHDQVSQSIDSRSHSTAARGSSVRPQPANSAYSRTRPRNSGARVVPARSQQSIVEPSALEPSALEPSALGPSALEPSAREPSALEGGQDSSSEGNANPLPPVQRPPALRPTPDPLPNDDSMMSFDDGMQAYADEGLGESYEGGGCSCGRCNGGNYFADLAPGSCDATCGMGMCDGPLSRLLGRMSVRAEVPIFWRRGIGLPPLVTTATAGTAANVAGQLGQSSTGILLGNNIVGEESQAGMRINVGTWLDPSCYRGVIVRYSNAGDQKSEFNFDSTNTPILARPFNNITTGTASPDTQLISFPGESSGNVRVSTLSAVDGFDIVMRRLAYRDRFTRVDWLMGYQHNRISESLQIASNTTVTGNVPPLTGSSIAVVDQLTTTNNFNGAVLGLMSTRQFAYWKFEAMGRLGLGSLERRVTSSGATTTTSSTGMVTTDPQGLLVRNTNNQTRQDDTFIVAPEFGLNVGYYLTQNIDFTVGYNYLLLGKIAQPGRQLDNTANLSDPLVGALRPGFVLDTQKYWVHSLNLGMQWRY